MSTIEEAREQAREALAQWDAPGGNHSGQVIGFLASALRALLDATEPPAQAEPAEDEREALTDLIEDYFDGDCWRGVSSELSSVISAAGYSKGPRPITDEMVAAADFAIMPYWGERYPSGSLTTEIARAALEAAEGARR